VPNISAYGTRTSVAGTDRIFIATGTSDQIDSATLTQVVSLASGGPTFTRPALSSFTESNHQSGTTATDISGGPIVVNCAPGGTYQQIDNWNQSVSGSEWMLTVCLSQSYCIAAPNNDYSTLGIGVKASSGYLFCVRVLGHQEQLDVITASSQSAYNSDLSAVTERNFSKVWYRLYYQSSDSSTPYTVYRSVDGYTWTYIYGWNGTSGVSGSFTASSVFFFADCGGNPSSYTGGTLWHWDIQTGTGSSLNPYSIVNPQ
jgi:hypothetical protein